MNKERKELLIKLLFVIITAITAYLYQTIDEDKLQQKEKTNTEKR